MGAMTITPVTKLLRSHDTGPDGFVGEDLPIRTPDRVQANHS
ncbi:hypothetical protein ACSSV4_003177 [Roseovarius sp. MBR-154]|jgi:hypothetical protein